MPYLTLGNYRPEKREHSRRGSDIDTDASKEHTNPNISQRLRPITHRPLTLDQYYYPTLIDTDSRDKDQVLSRYLDAKAMEAHREHDSEGTLTASTTTSQSGIEAKHSANILIVDQIWMWIVDESKSTQRITYCTKLTTNLQRQSSQRRPKRDNEMRIKSRVYFKLY